MNALQITVNKQGVERVSVVAESEAEEGKLLSLYSDIRPEISRIDKKITEGNNVQI